MGKIDIRPFIFLTNAAPVTEETADLAEKLGKDRGIIRGTIYVDGAGRPMFSSILGKMIIAPVSDK